MELLGRLSSLVAELCTCPGASDDVLRAASQLQEDASAQHVPDEAKPAMRRELVSAAAQLAALDAKLGAGLRTGSTPAAGVEESVSRHVTAACLALLAGQQLCRQCDLPVADADAARAFQGSVGLLMGCGTCLLEAYAGGRLRSAADGASGSGEQGAAASGTPWSLAEQCVAAQAKCMEGLLVMDAAGLAAVTDPSALARWLVAVCGAARTVHKAALDKGKPPPAGVLSSLVYTLHFVIRVEAPCLRAHRHAVEAQPDLPQFMFNLLEPAVRAVAVAMALPEVQRPKQYTWRLTNMLLTMMWPEVHLPMRALVGSGGTGSGGRPGGTAGGHDSGVGPAAHRLLARLVDLLHVAVSGLADAEGSRRIAMAACAIDCSLLAGSLCSAALHHCRTASSLGSQHWVELQRLKGPLLKAVPLMPRVLDIVHDTPTVAVLPFACMTEAQQQRALEQRQQQQQTGPVRQLQASFRRAKMAGTVYDSWATIVQLLQETVCIGSAARQQWVASTGAPLPVPPLADAAACCVASTAALRVVLHIGEATGAGQRDAERMLPQQLVGAADELAGVVMGLAGGAADNLCRSTNALTAAAAPAQSAGVTAALDVALALHSALCRCTQWMVQDGKALLGSLVPLIHAMKACAALHGVQSQVDAAPGLAAQTLRQMQGAAAATWHAMLAVATGREAELAADPAVSQGLAWMFRLACAQSLEALLTAQPVMGLLEGMFAHWSQNDTDFRFAAQAVLQTAPHHPRVALGLLRNGLLWQLTEAGSPGLVVQAVCISQTLVSEAESICQQPGTQSGGTSTEVWRQRLSQAAAPLRRALQQNAQTTGQGAMRRHLQQPAEQLVGALAEWWERPEQVAADRLELAQAAATRSCAYLRCANLAFQGGFAGQPGCGAQRCGKCRAVYYCGTACSHADWQAGHRQVCAELGAMRQQERAQQAQQAQH